MGVSKEDSVTLSRQLFDSLTVVKGFTQLSYKMNNIDYLSIVLQQSETMEGIITELVDLINSDEKDS